MNTFLQIMLFIVVAIIISVLLAFPTMWLWNWLMPAIFGLCEINFWQALGINILSTILFKNTSSSNKNE